MTARTKHLTPSTLAVRFTPEPTPPYETAALDIPSGRGHRVAAGRWGALAATLAALGAVILLLLAFGWYAVKTAPAELTPETYERVTEGMGREEVQAAIGFPAGDYRDGAHKPGGRRYTEWSEEAGEEEFGAGDTAGRLSWQGNAYSITAGFDEAGLVRWKTLWKHVPPTPRGPVERALAWLDH
jgi:hypothetical protein